ncbi:alpha/beta fold hydrolase [Parasedimentitalea huanghaiensis]|uniref:Alpha/beta fold hydrolase n=1 Tax=Parasedimentitalea huanghaiensis TaxID=2682100 RepID=A0A6L6WKV9_9RHOB|nr:alpha/beta fold hydrolase [Zongyanglinia huanghaiensis]MVO17778.1 alpha/beta fold hydrolase [Zongyanglinia huanghaiensis]
MTHYILVHGAWEGAWSWNETRPLLENAGHKVTAVALPGSPENEQDLSQVTMQNYVRTVVDAINQVEGKVKLVGHSLAGAIISQAAEQVPEKIEKLYYVAAFLLKNGDSIIEAMQRDPDGEFLPELSFSEDQSYATASAATWRDKAFHDVSDQDIQIALNMVQDLPQATEPFMAKIAVSDEKFGRVPKVYIRTSLDRMVSPKLQQEMLENWTVEQAHTLSAGHFPTLSLPAQLVEHLL